MESVICGRLLYRYIQYIKSRRFTNSLKSQWIPPDGFKTEIKVHSCITGEKVPVILKNPNFVSWYSCGPTVYDSAHIGHASSYVKLDIIQRIMKYYFKLNLVTSMGITDVDDKIIKKANELGADIQDIIEKNEKEFWYDMSRLGVMKPMIIMKVTQHIPCIKDFIKKLILSDDAYVTKDGSVYLDSTKVKNYGKLQNFSKSNYSMETFAKDKRNVKDFALWKGHKPNEPFWDADWGKGRPGWHIECSAMVSKYFGSCVDFHAGGIDLQFPHHENEEAQSCLYHGTPQWVNYWLHTGHLHVKGDVKMSKSLKNTISIGELLDNFSANAFRMACLMSNYKYGMEYSAEMMKTAETVFNKFKYFTKNAEKYINDSTSNYDESLHSELSLKLSETKDIVDKALKDDFETSTCINKLLEIIGIGTEIMNADLKNKHSISIAQLSNYVVECLAMFGVNLSTEDSRNEDLNFVLDMLIELRHNVRLNAMSRKDKELLILCDSVRDRLKLIKVKVNDSKSKSDNVSSWIYIK